nr:bacillithiol biosynthesis deacetylase BshB1 [Chitinophagaceae bacterium]
RENLQFKDGFFCNDEAHQRKLISAIRKYQPTIVLANAPRDRHPDHGRASQLIKDACYLSGLSKIITELNGEQQQAWRPKKVFFYIQDMYLEPHFILDISAVFEQKMQSIQAYSSQFYSDTLDGPKTYISSAEYLNMVKYRNMLMGKKIGAAYGEGYVLGESHLGLQNFNNLVLPEFA